MVDRYCSDYAYLVSVFLQFLGHTFQGVSVLVHSELAVVGLASASDGCAGCGGACHMPVC